MRCRTQNGEASGLAPEVLHYVLEGRCQLEVGDESVTVEADDVVRVPRGVPHLVHNPHYDEPCKLIAIGSPPEGRYPVTMYDNYEHVLADRYDEASTE